MFKKLLSELFNHERYQSISVILAACLLLFMYSCNPKCSSILFPDKKITQAELQGEIGLLQSRIDVATADLEQQQAIRILLIGLANSYAQTGVFSPMSALVGVLGLLGTGAAVDNVRKRKAVKQLETKIAEVS